MVRRNGPILLLVWAAGCLNALSFLGLGRVFTASLTGNTILLGLAIAQGDQQAIVREIIAITGFCLSTIGGTLLVTDHEEQAQKFWTRRICIALVIESFLLLVFALIWSQTHQAAPRDPRIVDTLIAISAFSMGLQSAIVLSLGIPAVSTTYVTGTVAALMVSIGHLLSLHKPGTANNPATVHLQLRQQKPMRLAIIWLTYIVAAIIGGFGDLHFSWLAVFLPLIAMLVVIFWISSSLLALLF